MTTYSQLLFNICHEVLRTGKRGRPTKVLPKGLVVRLKNKSSKRRDSEGKLKKVETPGRVLNLWKRVIINKCKS